MFSSWPDFGLVITDPTTHQKVGTENNPPWLAPPLPQSPPALCAMQCAWCPSVGSAGTSGSSVPSSQPTSYTTSSTTSSTQTSEHSTVTYTTGPSHSAHFLRSRLQGYWHDAAVPHSPSPNHVHTGCALFGTPDNTPGLTQQTNPTWGDRHSPASRQKSLSLQTHSAFCKF